jgi:hypothetical protein
MAEEAAGDTVNDVMASFEPGRSGFKLSIGNGTNSRPDKRSPPDRECNADRNQDYQGYDDDEDKFLEELHYWVLCKGTQF